MCESLHMSTVLPSPTNMVYVIALPHNIIGLIIITDDYEC